MIIDEKQLSTVSLHEDNLEIIRLLKIISDGVDKNIVSIDIPNIIHPKKSTVSSRGALTPNKSIDGIKVRGYSPSSASFQVKIPKKVSVTLSDGTHRDITAEVKYISTGYSTPTWEKAYFQYDQYCDVHNNGTWNTAIVQIDNDGDKYANAIPLKITLKEIPPGIVDNNLFSTEGYIVYALTEEVK